MSERDVMAKNICGWSRMSRKGSATVEFISVLPLVILMCLVVWQFVVAGMAVLETETLLSNWSRLAASSGELEEMEKQGREDFEPTGYYRLKSFEMKEKDDQIIVEAKTEIDLLFLPSTTVTYSGLQKTPLIR